MRNFDRISVHTKIAVLTVFLLAAVGGAGLAGWHALDQSRVRAQAALQRADRLAEAVDAARRAQVGFKIQVQEWKNILLRGGNLADYERYLRAFLDSDELVRADLKDLAGKVRRLDLDSTLVDNAMRAHEGLRKTYTEALRSYTSSYVASAFAADYLVRGVDRAPTEAFNAISRQLVEQSGQLKRELTAQLGDSFESASRSLLAALVLTLAAGGALAAWIARSIRTQLEESLRSARLLADATAQKVAAAKAIAGGDLDRQITPLALPPIAIERLANDEIGAVARIIAELGALEASLGEAFMTMTEAVRDSRRTLEATIDARTRELVRMAESLREEVEVRRQFEEQLRRMNELLEERIAVRTDELRQAMAKMLESEKLASLGRIVAGVAHEFNTPIGNCVTVASTLKEGTEGISSEVKAGVVRRTHLVQFLEEMFRGSELLLRNLSRATEIISSLKQVAVDQSSDRRRTFDLRSGLEDVLVTIEPLYRKTPYKLHRDLPVGILMDSYPGPLAQVITNLVTNALAHGMEGRAQGNMWLTARAVEDDRVEITFSDDGTGISEENVKRVFEPFFTTKLGRGGSGLGMNIVYNLVTGLLGGTIAVQSRTGEGTSITLSLPRCAPERAA